MKTAVAIALIVAGVVVVAIPPLSDAWRASLIARVMEHREGMVSMEGQLGDLYRAACWLLGAAMIGVGIVTSFIRASDTRSSGVSASAG